MPTKKSAQKWTSRQVRDLVMEILTYQNDSVQGSIVEMSGNATTDDNRLSREQVNSLISVLEPVLKDSAFKVLASKKL